MSKKFVRRVSFRYAKLGKGRKKKQVWRRPTGRDNKMREQRKGKPPVVKIGYKNQEKEKMKIVNSMRDVSGLRKGQKVVFGNIGMKKKSEIVKKLQEMNVEIANLNVKRFLKHVSARSEKKAAKSEKSKTDKSKGAKK